MTACGQCQGRDCTNAMNSEVDEMGEMSDKSDFDSSGEEDGNIFDKLFEF